MKNLEKNGAGFIALYDPTTVLELSRSPQGAFSASFHNCPFAKQPVRFLDMIANPLSGKPRFSAQNKNHNFSVLHHSYAVGRFLNQTNASEEHELLGFLHDAGEAFFVDVPSPFKMQVDEDRELAIIQAMPYPLLTQFMNDKEHTYRDVHLADYLSCVAEALLYGHDWSWPQEVWNNNPHLRGGVNMMKEIIIREVAILDKEAIIKRWIDETRCLLHLTHQDKVLS